MAQDDIWNGTGDDDLIPEEEVDQKELMVIKIKARKKKIQEVEEGTYKPPPPPKDMPVTKALRKRRDQSEWNPLADD